MNVGQSASVLDEDGTITIAAWWSWDNHHRCFLNLGQIIVAERRAVTIASLVLSTAIACGHMCAVSWSKTVGQPIVAKDRWSKSVGQQVLAKNHWSDLGQKSVGQPVLVKDRWSAGLGQKPLVSKFWSMTGGQPVLIRKRRTSKSRRR